MENSDVEVTPNWIEPIIELMKVDEKISACQPKVLDFKNKTHFEYAGAAGGYIDKFGYPFCRLEQRCMTRLLYLSDSVNLRFYLSPTWPVHICV